VGADEASGGGTPRFYLVRPFSCLMSNISAADFSRGFEFTVEDPAPFREIAKDAARNIYDTTSSRRQHVQKSSQVFPTLLSRLDTAEGGGVYTFCS
jgi:hypothetical protein